VKKTLPSGIDFKKHPRWLGNSASVNLGGGFWFTLVIVNKSFIAYTIRIRKKIILSGDNIDESSTS